MAYADLILHVVDASYDEHDFQIEVTDKVIEEIGRSGKGQDPGIQQDRSAASGDNSCKGRRTY